MAADLPPLPLRLDQISAPTILDCLADGAYITDPERRILSWNAAAERITGWPPDRVVGLHCRDNLLCHEDKEGNQLCGEELCPLHRSIVTGRVSGTPILVYATTQSGRKIPVEVSVGPIENGAGRIVGGIEVFRDLSETFEDLRRARVIQQNALRCELPADSRLKFAVCYQPFELMGGDFYRAEQVDEDQYAFLLADVSGHGTAAALYTMQIRSLWEEFRHLLNRPSELLSAFNQRLQPFCARDHFFATAVLVLLNVRTGAMEYAVAGHPAPILLGSQGEAEVLPNAGPGLGLLETLQFGSHSARLEPGQTLILYSDGAVEVPNADGGFLGESGLIDILRARDFHGMNEALEETQESLLRYSDQVNLPDDLTLMAIART